MIRTGIFFGIAATLAVLAFFGLASGPIPLAWALVFTATGWFSMAVPLALSEDFRVWVMRKGRKIDDQIDDERFVENIRKRAGV